ncbi:MAG: phenylacetate-CoA ligase [Parcubacteria group bacterium Gr01-1014_8]|nr:MAG: phenylacetate-CoA ligase [Parcubacteria group bacterium Gr01-1014_8]
MINEIRESIEYLRFHLLHRRSRSAIQRWQEKRLRMIIMHAAANVPLYKKLYALSGIEPEKIRTLEGLSSLPITRKETFLDRPREELIDNSQQIFSRWYNTSGTSGKPFTFLFGRNSTDMRYLESVCFRFISWQHAFMFDFSKLRVARIKIRSNSSRYRFFMPVKQFLSDPEDAIRKLASFKPEVLESYTSILFILAQKLSSDLSLPRIRPKYIVSFGEMLPPALRGFLETAMQSEVYDRYGIEEMSAVACECTYHDGQHLHSESIIAEIVDEEGRVLPPGQWGRVILTDLTNYNMPFIRYDTGDHGVISLEGCTCGLETPRIWFEGRYSAFLNFGGRDIHHLEFDAALDMFMDLVFQYQFAKTAEGALELRIVPGALFDGNATQRIESNVRELVGNSIAVKIILVANIPPTARGKCQIVVDETLV